MPPVETYAAYALWHASSSAADAADAAPRRNEGTLDGPVERVPLGAAHAPTPAATPAATPPPSSSSPAPRIPPAALWLAALVVGAFLAVALWHYVAHDDLQTHADAAATAAEGEATRALLTA